MYKPLPEFLTIKKSKIHGLGLFASKNIVQGQTLGISHIPHKDFEDGFIRTPVGGMVNHSDDPNVVKMKELTKGVYHLVAIRDINKGEEITVKYTFYNVRTEEAEA